jgi:hypothetical protein
MKIKFMILFLFCLFLSLFIKQIEDFCIEQNLLSWTLSMTVIKLIILISCIVLFVFSVLEKNKKIWIPIGIVSVAALQGLAFYKSPIYEGEFSSKKTKYTANQDDKNSVLINLFKTEPAFDGLFVIVNPECEHCYRAGKTIQMIKKRNPNLAISILVFTKQTKEIEHYQKMAGTQGIKHYLAENELDVFRLNLGAFPCFFYLKNQKVQDRWMPEEFNAMAIDELETLAKKSQN